MKAYLIWDDDPDGGHLSIQDWEPDMADQRRTVSEIREIDIPIFEWNRILNGQIEINVENPYSLDHILLPYWYEAGGLTEPK